MFNANADQLTLGYLGRALSLELSAVQQYSTQARLVASWGFEDAAQKLQKEAAEEFDHVQRIITRMLAVSVAPNASQLKPVRLGRNLTELLLRNQEMEAEIINLYKTASLHCNEIGDFDNRLFFATLLAEEQKHSQELSIWLQQLGHKTGEAR